MTNYLTLLCVCQFGGLIFVCGGFFLIYKQKISLDKTTRQRIKTIGPLGKFTTNSPAFGLFTLGFTALLVPIIKAPDIPKVKYLKIQQNIKSSVHPVLVYATVTSKYLPRGDGHFDLSIPVLESGNYNPELIYVAGDFLADNESLHLINDRAGSLILQEKTLQISHEGSGAVPPKPDIAPLPDKFKQ